MIFKGAIWFDSMIKFFREKLLIQLKWTLKFDLSSIYFWRRLVQNLTFIFWYVLKSVKSNFSLAVHSPKLDQAKTHFLSHIGEKNKKNMARPWFEPTISRSEVGHANHYSIGHLFEIWQIYLCYIHCDETKSESWPVRVLVSVLPE